MPSAGFELAIVAIEQPHTHALDRAAPRVCDVGVAVCYSKSRLLNLMVYIRTAHAGDRTTFSMRVQRTAAVKVTVIRNDLVTGYVCVPHRYLAH
jgi:hypothetical protein